MAECKYTPIDFDMSCGETCSEDNPCETVGWSMEDLSGNSPEHALFQSNLCEITDISGFSIEYRLLLPKNDWLWGEDPNGKLSYPSYSRAIYTPETETNLLDMFGLSADDTLQYVSIPKAIFARDLGMLYTDVLGPDIFIGPRVGDIIRTIWNDRAYEVVNISEEENIFMAKKYVWDIIVRPFRFSEQSDEHREVHTGLPDDPFESIITTQDGDFIQNNYAAESFGDNSDIDAESNSVYDYDDEGTQEDDSVDPDKSAFGR